MTKDTVTATKSAILAGKNNGVPEDGGADYTAGLNAMFKPRSVAIIGMSSKPGTLSRGVLSNVLATGFRGQIHLVGRSEGTIEGLPVLADFTDLPRDIDLAILCVPAAAVRESVEACVSRRIKSAVCFASGFAEMGERGRKEQAEIGRIARDGGLALVGPNCVGYFNHVDALAVWLVPIKSIVTYDPSRGRGIGIVTQSGAIGVHIAQSLSAAGCPVTYTVTTGNEAHLGVSDFIDFYLQDKSTGAIAVYCEQIHHPAALLRAARRAVECNKSIVLFHPGRSAKAQASAASHTGALAGDYAAMRAVVEHSGITVVETLEELVDVSRLSLRFPNALSGGGLGVVTTSGAICSIIEDYCDTLGIAIPPLPHDQFQALLPHLPDYTPPRNPLDLGTLPVQRPDLVTVALSTMLADPSTKSLVFTSPYLDPPLSTQQATAVAAGAKDAAKPFIYVIHEEGVPLAAEPARILDDNRIVVMRSPERALRALARFGQQAARKGRVRSEVAAAALPKLPKLGHGTQPEWLGKQVLKVLGIPVPPGGLVCSADEAVTLAQELGYPVVLKAQAAALAHKSEAGGVLLNIGNEAALRSAWEKLGANIRRAAPEITLDGALVETMGTPGVELVVGAYRDSSWGPILLVGLGGIWIEALGDVRLMPADLPEAQIILEFEALKGARLMHGVRGAAPVDIAAAARVASQIGRLMIEHSEIAEIDINPLIGYSNSVLALDALFVTE
ncbi:acetate--CoA ligase family protein [Pseudorhodoplanes sp.]|uniref:acetate--CoA ligase family protein n=1 Tax=Pseudorhodoplanes sp. TaxID=1934341 RepID=UPI003D0AD36F